MNGRARAMAGMRRQGFTSRQVAAAFGVSLRTVQRALEKHRDVEKRRDVASAASVKADIEGK
jgi:transposase